MNPDDEETEQDEPWRFDPDSEFTEITRDEDGEISGEKVIKRPGMWLAAMAIGD